MDSKSEARLTKYLETSYLPEQPCYSSAVHKIGLELFLLQSLCKAVLSAGIYQHFGMHKVPRAKGHVVYGWYVFMDLHLNIKV
jgi:hypothetical protein